MVSDTVMLLLCCVQACSVSGPLDQTQLGASHSLHVMEAQEILSGQQFRDEPGACHTVHSELLLWHTCATNSYIIWWCVSRRVSDHRRQQLGLQHLL